MFKEDIIKILEDSKEEARQKYKARLKGVFGSFVRGEGKETSDIDILVDFDDKADLFDLVGLGYYLEEKFGRKIDIVLEKYIRQELKEKILSEVIRL